jgi:hypothetical protein
MRYSIIVANPPEKQSAQLQTDTRSSIAVAEAFFFTTFVN